VQGHHDPQRSERDNRPPKAEEIEEIRVACSAMLRDQQGNDNAEEAAETESQR
jgi:hypothetical protein